MVIRGQNHVNRSSFTYPTYAANMNGWMDGWMGGWVGGMDDGRIQHRVARLGHVVRWIRVREDAMRQ
ncbi:unnamed protein product [Litomosoides sigmodontis]|uniref:Uncharacterized protein n=1 Tax=Litomosoides sigmodontis TaxID=42156 RepID=A0A3P6SZG9_LITSI|nr:unnamed protein product [Litomosoides sigmodontis]